MMLKCFAQLPLSRADVRTTTSEFVNASRRAMRLLVEDALAVLPMCDPITIQTPCGPCEGVERRISSSDITAVSIIRSGDCLVEVVREIEPNVRVGKILLQRDETTEHKRPVYVPMTKTIS
jgi:uracil phosphoribosyltransferase